MKIEGKGKLVEIEETQEINEKFKKRGFVVETNSEYSEILYFELFNDRVNLIDKFNIGDWVELSAFPKSKKWTSPQGQVKYFNTNSCVFIKGLEEVTTGEVTGQATGQATEQVNDDLPF